MTFTIVFVVVFAILAATVGFVVGVDIASIVTVVLLDLTTHTHNPLASFTEGVAGIVGFAKIGTLLVRGAKTRVQVGAITH